MKLKYGDFIIIGLVAALAVAALLLGIGSKIAGSGTAEVYQNGKLVRTFALDTVVTPVEFELDGAYHDHIRVEKGRIRFLSADCPDKVCVHTGWLTRVGQTAACLPNRVLIKIVGQSDQDVVIR